MRVSYLLPALIAASLMTSACWAQSQPVEKKEESGKARKAAPPAVPKSWYADCPGCASTLGSGGRAGPFATIEECREKVAKLVAQGYPYGFCRSDQ